MYTAQRAELLYSALSVDAAAAYTGTSPGLTTPSVLADFIVGPGGANYAAVSLDDFNNLRVKIATAITTLGDKIDSILNLDDLSCG